MVEQAITKLTEELKNFIGGQKETAVKQHVADTLKDFCRQDAEFAQAVVQNNKTLSDCCTEIMKGVGNSIADIEVYRRAVAFYFPGAGVKFTMQINLTASVERDEPTNQINLSLDDLLGF